MLTRPTSECTGIETLGERTRDRYLADDLLGAGLDALGVWLIPTERADPATPSAHWPGVAARR